MLLYLADNHILSTSDIRNPNKKFEIKTGSHLFEESDRDIIVFHKRQIKIYNRKDLGQKMTVFYMTSDQREERNYTVPLHVSSFIAAFRLFSSFDENTGEHTPFLYRTHEEKCNELQSQLEKLSVENCIITYKENVAKVTGSLAQHEAHKPSNTDDALSFLYGLALVYGTFQAAQRDNQDELLGVKIHVPVFGQFSNVKDKIHFVINLLKKDGILIDHDEQDSNDGSMIQLIINDFEVLAQFAEWHKPIAGFDKITKKDRIDFLKSLVIEYLEANSFDPADIDRIRAAVLKPLTIT